MASLKNVDLSGNNINHASKDELCSMANLETINLRNNPLNDEIKEQLVTSLVDKVTIL
jgi:Leucine-rich repeat (LRR) protein